MSQCCRNVAMSAIYWGNLCVKDLRLLEGSGVSIRLDSIGLDWIELPEGIEAPATIIFTLFKFIENIFTI